MKKVALLSALAFVICGIGFVVGLSYITGSARESIEHDNPCESYQTLKWISFVSKESKYLLAGLYSKGVCSPQNIAKAKKLYASVYGDNLKMVAQALFNDAIQLSDFYERSGTDQNYENIHSLLAESKSLGFELSDKESNKLKDRKLSDFFK